MSSYGSFISAAVVAIGLVVSGSAQAERPAVKPGWKPISECDWRYGTRAQAQVTKAIIPLIKRPKDADLSAVGGWSYPRKTTREGCMYTVTAAFPTTNKYGVRIRGNYKATATLDKDTGYWTVEVLELYQGGMFE